MTQNWGKHKHESRRGSGHYLLLFSCVEPRLVRRSWGIVRGAGYVNDPQCRLHGLTISRRNSLQETLFFFNTVLLFLLPHVC
jgi:hypothetical protein